MPLSLSEFAAKRSAMVRPCPVCALPPGLLMELHEGREAGYGMPTLMNWLKTEYPKESAAATRHHLEKHFGEKHEAATVSS